MTPGGCRCWSPRPHFPRPLLAGPCQRKWHSLAVSHPPWVGLQVGPSFVQSWSPVVREACSLVRGEDSSRTC